MIVIKDKAMHLVFSEDDGEYYWERLSDWKRSQSFKSGRLAILARQKNELVFS